MSDPVSDGEATSSGSTTDGAPTTEVQSGRTKKSKKTKKKALPWWLETIVLLGVALVLALVIKTFFVQAFYIPSPSMVPGLVKNDRILVEKPSYWFGEPQRGDVVVFADPGDWLLGEDADQPTSLLTKGMSKIGLYPTGGHLVKRVIGVPGDVIVCCDSEGRLSVNGQPLDEDGYVNHPDSVHCRGPKGPGNCHWTEGPVPAGDLFVMGDNRADSADSSFHMCRAGDGSGCDDSDAYVPEDLVVGRVFAVIWPRDHMTWLHRPATFSHVPDSPPASE